LLGLLLLLLVLLLLVALRGETLLARWLACVQIAELNACVL